MGIGSLLISRSHTVSRHGSDLLLGVDEGMVDEMGIDIDHLVFSSGLDEAEADVIL